MAALSENSVALEEFESVKDIYQDFKGSYIKALLQRIQPLIDWMYSPFR